MELKIEYLNKNELKPYVNNAKIHTPDQVEQIKKSIREFGFNDPIAVWHENEIVEGHGRLLAAMEMGDVTVVPVIRLDDLTDKQRKAYALAHNKLTMNTDFDLDLLATEISDIGDDLDLTDFGFNEAELLELEIDDSPADIPVKPSGAQFVGVFSGENTPETPQQVAGGDFGYQPGSFTPADTEVSREELRGYEEQAKGLVSHRVIIVYRTDEEEAFVRSLLGSTEERLGVIYTADALIKKRQEAQQNES